MNKTLIAIPYKFIKSDLRNLSDNHILINTEHIVSISYHKEDYPGRHAVKGSYSIREVPRESNYIILSLSNETTVVINSYRWVSNNPVTQEDLDKYNLDFKKFCYNLEHFFSKGILEFKN